MIQPPSVGPRIGATMMPAPQIAIACPTFSRGLMSSMMDCDIGISAAPNRPWMKRNTTISGRLVAMPHNAEASVKPATAICTTALRPNRSPIQPESGVAIAAATM